MRCPVLLTETREHSKSLPEQNGSLLRAAALGTVSSLAAGRDGVIYVLALRNGGHQKTLAIGSDIIRIDTRIKGCELKEFAGVPPSTGTPLNRRLQRSQSRLQIACRRIITIQAS